MQIFIGNLSFVAKDSDLVNFFKGHGVVTSAKVVMKKNKKKSRGFGFVEISDEAEAKAAIVALNGKELLGRVVTVTEVLPTAKTIKIDRKKVRNDYSQDAIADDDEFNSEDDDESDEESSDEDDSELEVEENFNKEGAGESPKEDQRSYRYHRKYDDRSRGSRNDERPWSNRRGPQRSYVKQEGPERFQNRSEEKSRYYKKSKSSYPGKSSYQSAKPWEKRENGSRSYRGSMGSSNAGRPFSREAKPWVNREENFDKRTRPRRDAGKPYEKREGNFRANRASKPWDNRATRGGSGFRGRPEAGARPYARREGGSSYRGKSTGEAKPYVNNERGSTFRGNAQGRSTSYEKREGNYRRTKPAYSAKPWIKSEGNVKPRSNPR